MNNNVCVEKYLRVIYFEKIYFDRFYDDSLNKNEGRNIRLGSILFKMPN